MINHILGTRRCSPRRRQRRGQSLVEFALVLPILLVIVAGTLEVGNVLTLYLRVQHAAREGARFAAAGGVEVRSIIDQSSREALELDEDYMTVWVIRPTIVAQDGSGYPLAPADWYWLNASAGLPWGVEEQCIFGDRCPAASNPTPNPISAQRVLEDLPQTVTLSAPAAIHDTTFAVVVVYYEVDTIPNLPFWRADSTTAEGRVPVWAYGIMAQQVENEAISLLAGGCSAYPFAISERALEPYFDEMDAGEKFELTTPLNFCHTNDGSYEVEGVGFVSWNLDMYELSNGALTSSGVPTKNHRAGSVTGSWVSLHPDWGFNEYLDPNPPDRELSIGDWVLGLMNEQVGVIQEDLTIFRNDQREMRVFVYRNREDPYTGDLQNPRLVTYDKGGGVKTGMQYEIGYFIILKVVDFDHTSIQENQSITWEFQRIDNSCGTDIDG